MKLLASQNINVNLYDSDIVSSSQKYCLIEKDVRFIDMLRIQLLRMFIGS
jgi:hypothetical protein